MEELWLCGAVVFLLQALLLPYLVILGTKKDKKYRQLPLPYPKKWFINDYPYYLWSESKKELYRQRKKPTDKKKPAPVAVPVEVPVAEPQAEPAAPLVVEVACGIQTGLTTTACLRYKPIELPTPKVDSMMTPEEQGAEVSPVEQTQDDPTDVTQDEAEGIVLKPVKPKPVPVVKPTPKYVGGQLVGKGKNREIVVASGPVTWTAKGGQQKIKVTNVSGVRQAIKVKCSDNGMFRVNPVMAFIEPDSEIDLDVYRAHGKPKADQLVILNTAAEASDTDPGALFLKPSYLLGHPSATS